METEVLVKLDPELAAWADQRARAANTDVPTLLATWAGQMRREAQARKGDTESLLAQLQEKYPPSAGLQELKGSLRLSMTSDEEIDELRYKYLREKYGL